MYWPCLTDWMRQNPAGAALAVTMTGVPGSSLLCAMNNIKITKSNCSKSMTKKTSEREEGECLKSGSISNKWGWPNSPQQSINQININNLLWSAKSILPAITSLHTFFLNLFLPYAFWPPLALDLQPQNLIPFSRHDHPPSSTYDHANEHCLP